MKFKDKIFIGTIVLLLAGLIAFVFYKKNYSYRKLPYYTFTLNGDEYTYSEFAPDHKVGNFQFINQQGKKIDQNSTSDCIYIADYIFTTCPGICKVMSSQMTQVYNEFKGEEHFKILSHTSKPEEDSIPALAKYAEQQGADNPDKWIFLTGDKKELQRMAYEQYGIINKKDLDEEGSFVHTEMFVLVDKDKYIRGYYDGTNPSEVNQMKQDIHELLKEQFR